jgi:hypothetical protein
VPNLRTNCVQTIPRIPEPPTASPSNLFSGPSEEFLIVYTSNRRSRRWAFDEDWGWHLRRTESGTEWLQNGYWRSGAAGCNGLRKLKPATYGKGIYQQLRLRSYPIIDGVLRKTLVLCDQQRDNYAHAFGSRKAGRATHAGGLAVGPYAADGSYEDHDVQGDMDDCRQQGEPNERQPRRT